MQIILVQTEVEQALRDYVGNRLTLAEGTEIKIELTSTRGPNGLTATIDLVEPGSVATVAKETAAPAVQSAKVTQPQGQAQKAAEKPAEQPQDDQGPKDNQQEVQHDPAQTGGQEQAASATATAEAGAAASASAEKPAETPAAGKPNLFGGLRKVVNQPQDQAAQ